MLGSENELINISCEIAREGKVVFFVAIWAKAIIAVK